jgi:hypothetical protein
LQAILNKFNNDNNSLYAIVALGIDLNRISLMSFRTVVDTQNNEYHYCIKLKNVDNMHVYVILAEEHKPIFSIFNHHEQV